jgi:hypothetical protein
MGNSPDSGHFLAPLISGGETAISLDFDQLIKFPARASVHLLEWL